MEADAGEAGGCQDVDWGGGGGVNKKDMGVVL